MIWDVRATPSLHNAWGLGLLMPDRVTMRVRATAAEAECLQYFTIPEQLFLCFFQMNAGSLETQVPKTQRFRNTCVDLLSKARKP